MNAVKSNRLDGLDFTKGALVLTMVLYHWLNYFARPDLDYRYLRFLTPSFLFITGFLISHVYLVKYDGNDGRLSRRLAWRGVKLLILFAVLNLAKTAISPGPENASTGSSRVWHPDLFKILVLGPMGSEKVASFYIFVPISYLLFISAGMLYPYRAFRYAFHALSAFLLAAILVLNVNQFASATLEFVTLGTLGILSGFVPIQQLEALAGRPGWLIVAYVIYVAAITVWNVPFWLLLLGVCLTLLGLYHIGSMKGWPRSARHQMIVLGQYSLFGYIAQVAILQVLSATQHRVPFWPVASSFTFVAAFVLTLCAVDAMAVAKRRSRVVDRLYRTAFA
jgi:hypothetical protein